MKDLEFERANRSAPPCAVERKDEGCARSDESKGESRCGQTQTMHEWDDIKDGDDRDRPQMADDDANDSQALTGGDITRYRASAACHKTDQISSSHQCRYVMRWQNQSARDKERVKRIGRYLAESRQQSAGSTGSRVASWKRLQTLIGEATKPLDVRCRPESS